jgi:chromosome segregation ATPase
MEKERIESRLQEMQRNIDSLARQQESLKADLAKALQQGKDANAKATSAGKTGSGQRPAENSEGRPGDGQEASAQQNQTGTDGGPGEGQDGTQASQGEKGSSTSGGSQGPSSQSDGQSAEAPSGQSGQQGAGQSGHSTDQEGEGAAQSGSSAGQFGEGPGGASARRDARMRMLQAKQKALRERTSQLSEEMDGLPAPESSAQGRAKQQAQGHLDQAADAMKQFEERLADTRFGSSESSEAGDMSDPADAAARRLAEAGQAIRRGLLRQGQDSADKAQEMAEQLAEDVRALDESLSEAEKQKMQDRLAAAQRLLESMAGTQWATISRGGGPGGGHVYTNDPHASAADTARLLARQLWSVALEAKKRRSRPVEEGLSDVEFFEAENEFFETAARFKQGRVEK